MLPRPIDRLLAGYNLLLGVLWAGAMPEGLVGSGAVLAHGAACLLPTALDWAARRGIRPLGWLREVYPLLFLLVFWTELGQLIPQLHRASNDGMVAQLDLALFGQHWSTAWRARMSSPWLVEVMFAAYLLYLPAIFLPVLWLGLRGQRDAMGDVSFRLLVTYVVCYLIYLAFPVLGPREALPGGSLAPDGFFAGISEALRNGGDSLGTAFPSSHAAGAVTIAIALARWTPRWIGVGFALEAGAVVLATVYTGNHYAVDAVAGTLLALAVQLALVPALLRGFGPSPSQPTVPLLPRFGAGVAPAFRSHAA